MAIKKVPERPADISSMVTVVIRSSGERTERLCRELILAQGQPEDSIFTVRQTPFSLALAQGFEIGIRENRKWTLYVDADVLLRRHAIQLLVERAESLPENVCEVQGLVLDKFFGAPRTAGNHLYRTVLLDQALSKIPEEGVDIRPETYTLNKMAENGYRWVTIEATIGLHGFQQHPRDIFRTCFVHAHKHSSLVPFFLEYWRSEASQDIDFRIALAGLGAGISHTESVRIDRTESYFDPSRFLGMSQTIEEIDESEWSPSKIESIIRATKAPNLYWDFFPWGQLARPGNPLRSILVFLTLHVPRVGMWTALTALAGRFFKKHGSLSNPKRP